MFKIKSIQISQIEIFILFSNTAENKLPLLWSLVLRLSTFEDDQTADYLLRIANAATQLAQYKQSWSLFDTIRLQKQTNISPKFVVYLLLLIVIFINSFKITDVV